MIIRVWAVEGETGRKVLATFEAVDRESALRAARDAGLLVLHHIIVSPVARWVGPVYEPQEADDDTTSEPAPLTPEVVGLHRSAIRWSMAHAVCAASVVALTSPHQRGDTPYFYLNFGLASLSVGSTICIVATRVRLLRGLLAHVFGCSIAGLAYAFLGVTFFITVVVYDLPMSRWVWMWAVGAAAAAILATVAGVQSIRTGFAVWRLHRCADRLHGFEVLAPLIGATEKSDRVASTR